MVEPPPDDDVASETTVFPVVLYDGDREVNVGNISIHPDLVYKAFQVKLSEMTGISYNNLTTYLIDNKKSKSSPDRRKILITGKVNFAVIVRERNCYFFVVLKRSRRERRRRPTKQINYHDINDYNDYHYYHHYMNMILTSGYEFDLPNFPRIEDAYPRVSSKVNRPLCVDCTVALKQGKSPEFHCCVYDEVVVGWFRSPAGPICRPWTTVLSSGSRYIFVNVCIEFEQDGIALL